MNNKNKNKDWIGVDLDGTLAHYDRWRGVDHIGEPIPIMVNRVKKWLAAGITVKIFTARIYGRDLTEVLPPIWRWCEEQFGQRLPVTNIKEQSMVVLYDDRAVRVVKNTGELIL